MLRDQRVTGEIRTHITRFAGECHGLVSATGGGPNPMERWTQGMHAPERHEPRAARKEGVEPSTASGKQRCRAPRVAPPPVFKTGCTSRVRAFHCYCAE